MDRMTAPSAVHLRLVDVVTGEPVGTLRAVAIPRKEDHISGIGPDADAVRTWRVVGVSFTAEWNSDSSSEEIEVYVVEEDALPLSLARRALASTP